MSETGTIGSLMLAVELEAFTCGTCGGAYALSARYIAERRANGGRWRCPYCTGNATWGYDGQTEVEKLRKRLQIEEAAKERAQQRATELSRSVDHERKRVQGYQGALTKIKKRIGNGTCPCCQRHFVNVERHMASKHPEYAGAES